MRIASIRYQIDAETRAVWNTVVQSVRYRVMICNGVCNNVCNNKSTDRMMDYKLSFDVFLFSMVSFLLPIVSWFFLNDVGSR